MQQEGSNARQLIVERVRQATNILVAVSVDPSVDALSAALGLALMLNKMDKHATAVFSGKMPPAMEFLAPDKTFESTVDSLRDFIISLDKEKADRLRYKVEEDVVKIFITPYRTTITDKDLNFSQGDFNVELIVALGVDNREDLDKAIVAHGRILHDATVVTVNPNDQKSSLGAIDWHDGGASSLCEMLVSMSESFQQPGLIDSQISTALLTGIVAATERFSNEHTSPRVMTMAAQLMAAGANQQLIATNLQKAHEIPVGNGPLLPNTTDQPKAMPKEATPPPPKKTDGELDIAHEKKEQKPEQSAKKVEKPAEKPQPASIAPTQPAPTPTAAPNDAEAALEASLPTAGMAPVVTPEELEQAAAEEKPAPAPAPKQRPAKKQRPPKTPGSEEVNDADAAPQDQDGSYLSTHSSWNGKRLEPPTLGGTLNATAEEALQDERKAEEEDRNKTILTHPEDTQASDVPPPAPAPEPAPAPSLPPVPPAPAPVPEPTPPAQPPSLEELQQQAAQSAAEAAQVAQPAESVAGDVNAARQAVTDALNEQPFNPSNQPLKGMGSTEIPEEPNLAPTTMPQEPTPAPSDLPPLPPLPPMPADLSMPPPIPQMPELPTTPGPEEPPTLTQQPPEPQPPQTPAPSNNPGEFKIPGA